MRQHFPELCDRALWQRTPDDVQDRLIIDVAHRLHGAFTWLETRTYACGGEAHRIAAFEHHRTRMRFHLIPGGAFVMGSAASAAWSGDGEETPTHEVRLEPFLIGQFLVTVEQWLAGGGHTSDTPDGAFVAPSDHPAEGTSRSEARAWAERVGLRLPTESEWEYAARAGTTTAFFWGEEMNSDYCWYKGNSAQGAHPHPATPHQGATNAFGLIDPLGNLCEWVEDDYLGDYALCPTDGSAYRAQRSYSDGLQRGGQYNYSADLCRCAARIITSDYGDAGMGFRAACTIPD